MTSKRLKPNTNGHKKDAPKHRLSPSTMSGIALGATTGAFIGGPVGAVVGIVVGGAAGEALERLSPSAPGEHASREA